MIRVVLSAAFAVASFVLVALTVRQYRAGDQSGRSIAIVALGAATSVLGLGVVVTSA